MKPESQLFFILKRGYLAGSILLLIISFNARSQDIHFTQFNNCPLFINPANTGNFSGDWRVAVNYRDQWRALTTPYTTAAASFDKQFFIFNQNISAGAFFINDQSGIIGLSANKFYLSLAYEKQFRKNTLRGGLQTGYVFRSYGSGLITYPVDYNRDAFIFEPNGNTGEKRSYFDIVVGLLWKTAIRKFEPEAGISLAHVNLPNESFFDAKERLTMRYAIHGSVKTKVSDEFYFKPVILLMNQRTANELLIGSEFGLDVFKKRSNVKGVNAGLYFRDGVSGNPDAFAVTGGITVGRIDLSLGYDITISGLKVASGSNGAFEISIIYRSISTVLNSYSIPCERL